ncbi:MAG: 2-oxoacid:acceptor oxidoreductase family protein [Endomicrobiales bacterium]|nr:2-oxoacid:acceptor oxidoreductase family protein [Endomicrobiales bacterium]
MKHNIIIAGFGGQGALSAGMLLAQAALEEGKLSTWFPSYGAEIRGGTANSTVVISTEEIGSPIVLSSTGLIALNELSLVKFSKNAVAGAIIVVNTSLVPKEKIIIDNTKKYFFVPATELANKLGNVRVANSVALGAFLKASKALSLESAIKACPVLLESKKELIELNIKALELGFSL